MTEHRNSRTREQQIHRELMAAAEGLGDAKLTAAARRAIEEGAHAPFVSLGQGVTLHKDARQSADATADVVQRARVSERPVEPPGKSASPSSAKSEPAQPPTKRQRADRKPN